MCPDHMKGRGGWGDLKLHLEPVAPAANRGPDIGPKSEVSWFRAILHLSQLRLKPAFLTSHSATRSSALGVASSQSLHILSSLCVNLMFLQKYETMLSLYLMAACKLSRQPIASLTRLTASHSPGTTLPPFCKALPRTNQSHVFIRSGPQASGIPSFYCPSVVTWLASLTSQVLSSCMLAPRESERDLHPLLRGRLSESLILSALARLWSIAQDAREPCAGPCVVTALRRGAVQ